MDRIIVNNAYRYKNTDGSLDSVHYCLNGECDSFTDIGQPMIDNDNGTHTCPSCSKTVTTDINKFNAYGEAAAAENERRTDEINRWHGW